MDGGWSSKNSNQKSFYTTVEKYFADHPTYHMRDLILPKNTLDYQSSQKLVSCVTDKTKICKYT